MRDTTHKILRANLLLLVAALSLGCATVQSSAPADSSNAQQAAAEAYKAPRLPGSNVPNLNGVWQALNSANYNIETHVASHSMQTREGPAGPVPAVKTLYLGAVGAVPPGLGVVVEGEIPYLPEARKVRDENKANCGRERKMGKIEEKIQKNKGERISAEEFQDWISANY